MTDWKAEIRLVGVAVAPCLNEGFEIGLDVDIGLVKRVG